MSGGFAMFTPILRHVPMMLLHSDLTGRPGWSSCLMLAISYTCCSDSVPADSCPGFWLPDFFPSARFTKNDTGGVLISCHVRTSQLCQHVPLISQRTCRIARACSTCYCLRR